MDQQTRLFVRQRAGHRCEYCHIPQHSTPLIPFHVEHIIAQQHVEDDHLNNLALACDRCNAYKGPNLTSIDSATGQIVPLFHPRRDSWDEHFREVSGMIYGYTPNGRATVKLLHMNADSRVRLRREVNED